MTSTEPFAGAVRIDVSLASPQQAVWETITDSSRLSEWLGGPVEIDPVVGGRIRFELPDDGVVASGVVRDVQPPRPGMAVALLVHTFVDARSPDAVSECRWSVVDAGDGTSELHFTHDGFGEIPPSSVWGGRLGRRTPIGHAKVRMSGQRRGVVFEPDESARAVHPDTAQKADLADRRANVR